MDATDSPLEKRAIIAAGLLALDSVERAESGHPGAALLLAPVADLLFQKRIRHDPRDPSWIGRDRFVLSCGYGDVLQTSARRVRRSCRRRRIDLRQARLSTAWPSSWESLCPWFFSTCSPSSVGARRSSPSARLLATAPSSVNSGRNVPTRWVDVFGR